MTFPKDTSFHLIGIAGTAMAGTAILLQELGYQVQGSDEAIYPPMSTLLDQMKIKVLTPYSIENIPNQEKTVIVVGNAISRGNVELELALNKRLPLFSMPEILRFLVLMKREPIVIAGTHGKTTTTSLMVHCFKFCNQDVGYLIGGIPKNFQRNAKVGSDKFFVIEGDEYDTAYFDKRSKFLHYVPKVVILLNLEFDHADIFSSVQDIEKTFLRLILTIPENGLLIYPAEDERLVKLTEFAKCHKISFGIQDGDVRLLTKSHLTSNHKRITFPDGRIEEFETTLVGNHNLKNILAVSAAAYGLNLNLQQVFQSFKTFVGVQRRAEIVFNGDVLVIDDFGHHPTAIYSTLMGIKEKYPNRRILVAFDPRSNTSVRNYFQNEWVKTFSVADQVWINQLHRLEKIPIHERLNREKLVADLEKLNVRAYAPENSEQLLEELKTAKQENDIIVFFSNGSFNGIKERFVEFLKSKV